MDCKVLDRANKRLAQQHEEIEALKEKFSFHKEISGNYAAKLLFQKERTIHFADMADRRREDMNVLRARVDALAEERSELRSRVDEQEETIEHLENPAPPLDPDFARRMENICVERQKATIREQWDQLAVQSAELVAAKRRVAELEDRQDDGHRRRLIFQNCDLRKALKEVLGCAAVPLSQAPYASLWGHAVAHLLEVDKIARDALALDKEAD